MTKYKIIMERSIETEYFVEAENEEEIQRRDEKNGLYPHWWNDSN